MQILCSFVAKRVPTSVIHWPSRTSLLMNASWWLKLNQDCMWNWQNHWQSQLKYGTDYVSWPWKYCVALEADSLMSQTLCLRVFWLMWASFVPFCIWLFLCVHYFCRLWHLATNWMDYYYNCPVWNGCKMMIQYREVQTMLWSKINLATIMLQVNQVNCKLNIFAICQFPSPLSYSTNNKIVFISMICALVLNF